MVSFEPFISAAAAAPAAVKEDLAERAASPHYYCLPEDVHLSHRNRPSTLSSYKPARAKSAWSQVHEYTR